MKKILLFCLVLIIATTFVGCFRKKPLSTKKVQKLYSSGIEAILDEGNWEKNFYFGFAGETLLVMNGEIYVSSTSTKDHKELLQIKDEFKETIISILNEAKVESFVGWYAASDCAFISYQLTDEQSLRIFGNSAEVQDGDRFLHVDFYKGNNICVTMEYPYEGDTPFTVFGFFVKSGIPYAHLKYIN